jgi:hypothetical protein
LEGAIVATLVVGILSLVVSAASFGIAALRYRREVENKQLSYFVEPADRDSVSVYVWNSGNTPIEEEDFISDSIGFDFGREVQIRDVSVEFQSPEDLGVNVTLEESGRLEVPAIFLNPGDRFTLRALFSNSDVQGKLRPYGRIRGIHDLFRVGKPEAKEFGETTSSSPSRGTKLFAIIGILFLAMTLLLVAFYQHQASWLGQ